MNEKPDMIALTNRTNRSTRLFGKTTNPITASARKTLEENPIFRGRSALIRIDENDGRLVLEGRLPSFYLKQMLQTILRDVDGVEQVENRVRVDWPTTT